MKSLNAKLIKDIGSQTITYKGSLLTVSWGGEYYTAIHKGEVFRQCTMVDLKRDIREEWVYSDMGNEEDLAEQLVKQELNLARMAKAAAAPAKQIKVISQTTAATWAGYVVSESKCYMTVCVPNYYGQGRNMVERLYKRDGAMYLDHMFLSFYVEEVQ